MIARILAIALLVAGTVHAQVTAASATSKAIFAGGCFWCTESDFEKVPGVLTVVSGYTGGHLKNPKYEDTHDGSTGHTESIEVTFDPAKVTYAQLVDYFWHHHDPFDGGGQFCDHGNQYRPAIFFLDAEQEKIATASRDALAAKFGKAVATEITKAGTFWPAEDYHQDYYKKNPIRYHYYRTACGRDARVEAIWKGVR